VLVDSSISVRLVTADLNAQRSVRPRAALLAQYIAGGLIELIVMWLERPTGRSADEVTDAFLAPHAQVARVIDQQSRCRFVGMASRSRKSSRSALVRANSSARSA
jgi:hypothetical protein